MSKAIINEPDRVIMEGDWASEIVYNVAYSETENIEQFNELFTYLGSDKDYLANSSEPFYQGAMFMTVIMRKSDDKLFGYEHWDAIGKHASSEMEAEANGDEHGWESESNYNYASDTTTYTKGPYWVWLPVKSFVTIGYEFEERPV